MSPLPRRLTAAFGGLVAACAFVMSTLPGTAQAVTPTRTAPDGVLTLPMADTKAKTDAVADYWKPDRLRSADDSTPKTADPKPSQGSASAAGPAAASARSTTTAATATAASATPASAAGGGSLGWSVPPVPPKQGGTRVSGPVTAGKVFFKSGGKDYWCSASAVRAKSRSLVATAAHCAFDLRQNKPMDHWIFVPAYRPGSQPEGIYVGQTLTLHSDYGMGDYDYDYAFVTVHRGFTWQQQKDAKGQPVYEPVGVGLLQDNVGGLGITAGRGAAINATAFGYPAGAQPDGRRPYTGHTLEQCAGGTRLVKAPTYLVERGISIRECGFTAGASGGPWLLQYNKATGSGYLVGINSFSWDRDVDGENDEISSPYFSSSTRTVYGFAETVVAT